MAETWKDKFANLAAIDVTESAANTLTFEKLETGVGLFEKIAWIIHRLEYRFLPSLSDFADSGDRFEMAICTSNQITDLSQYDEPAILDFRRFLYLESGTPANFTTQWLPLSIDLSMMPGGGLIVPPNPLYLGVKGTGLGSAVTAGLRMWYTTLPLKPEDYWELVEARRIIAT